MDAEIKKALLVIILTVFTIMVALSAGNYVIASQSKTITMDKDKDFEERFNNVIYINSEEEFDNLSQYKNPQEFYLKDKEAFIEKAQGKQVYIRLFVDGQAGLGSITKVYFFVDENNFVMFNSYYESSILTLKTIENDKVIVSAKLIGAIIAFALLAVFLVVMHFLEPKISQRFKG